MDSSGRDREPRSGIQCPKRCGPVHVKGVRKEEITCPCGYGYYSKRTGEFVSGDLVRAGRAPPKDSEEIRVPNRCWNDPTRDSQDEQVHEFPGHDSSGYEQSKMPRHSSVDLGPTRHGQHPPTSEVRSWVPSKDIDFEVISNDLELYLGPLASVVESQHPQDGRPGFFIRAASTLTASMISDLEEDSFKWQRELRDPRSKDSKSSQTYKLRRMHNSSRPQPPNPQGRIAPSDRVQSSINYQLSREETSRPMLEKDSIPRSSRTALSFLQGPDLRETSYGDQRGNIPSTPQRDSREQSNDLRLAIEAKIARMLRDRGTTNITRDYLDSLVDQEMQKSRATSIGKEAIRMKH